MKKAIKLGLQKLYSKPHRILNTSNQISLISILLLFTSVTLLAQSTYQFGALPSVNFNKKLEKDWSFNFRIESRQVFERGTFGSAVDRTYDYVLTDATFIAAKTVGLNSRLAGGYLMRFRENKIIHRSIQQFTIVHRMSCYRLSNRFVTDQTFTDDESPEFRIRYRLSAEIPLNGTSVDPTEFYVRLNNEYLNSWQASEYDLEIRLVPLLGYSLSNTNKIELGLDYRINSFLENASRQSFWMTVNWFIEL